MPEKFGKKNGFFPRASENVEKLENIKKIHFRKKLNFWKIKIKYLSLKIQKICVKKNHFKK